MKYKTVEELYLTFLTRNDSYMQNVPVGSVLELKGGDLMYNGKTSIDNHTALLLHGFIEELHEY